MAKIAEARKTVEQLKLEVNIDRMKVRGGGGEEGVGSGAGVWTRRRWGRAGGKVPCELGWTRGGGTRVGGVVTKGAEPGPGRGWGVPGQEAGPWAAEGRTSRWRP